MSARLILAAVAATFAFAAPALAQETAPAAPAPAQAAPPAPKSPEEAAMEAKATAFRTSMQQMQGELAAAVQGAGADQAKGLADVDVVLARYQPQFDAFATDLEAFIDGEIAKEGDAAKREEMTKDRAEAGTAIRGIPAMIRTQAQQALAAQANPAPAAPATPQ